MAKRREAVSFVCIKIKKKRRGKGSFRLVGNVAFPRETSIGRCSSISRFVVRDVTFLYARTDTGDEMGMGVVVIRRHSFSMKIAPVLASIPFVHLVGQICLLCLPTICLH